MVNQSLKHEKSRQSLKKKPRSFSAQEHHQGQEVRPILHIVWLGLLVSAVAFGVIIFVTQVRRRPRVYDNSISAKVDTPPSRRDPARPMPPKMGPRPENTSSLERLIEQIKPSVIFIQSRRRFRTSGEGSGFVVGKGGYILTCYHVIEGANRITVSYTNANGKMQRSSASLIWSEADRDIALIRAKQAGDLVPMELGNADNVGQGHQIIAIGYPLGSSLGIEPTVTTGIVSSIRYGNNRKLLQISAAVNPGNSGGALISVEKEQVIGIVGAKIPDAEGIGFAIPITDNLKRFLIRKFAK